LGTESIDFPAMYGIYLPQQEILNRMKYAWFARMSPLQIMESSLTIKKYIVFNI